MKRQVVPRAPKQTVTQRLAALETDYYRHCAHVGKTHETLSTRIDTEHARISWFYPMPFWRRLRWLVTGR